MRNTFLFILLPFILAGLFQTAPQKKQAVIPEPVKTDILGCAPGSSPDQNVPSEGKLMIALPGWGQHHYTISTNNDSAQFFFNQGLSMYYSYHWREANASFREASRLDPECAMFYWGQALARGPAYNFAHLYKMPNEIPELIKKMTALKVNASDKEKQLIEAMTARYSSDSTDQYRKKLNSDYAAKMQQLVAEHPQDAEIAALYIDAVMLQHPWNFWNNDGTPKPWTPELMSLAEKIFEISPKHPGALHYYIHITEASRNPERALQSADALKDLLPGVAHMVHMSSHVYERNGSYAKGVEVNEKADQDLMLYDSMVRNLNTLKLSPHVPHYFAVQSYCALTGGIYAKGMPLAFRLRESVSPSYDNTYDQYLFMTPVLAWVRMGKWNEILADKELPKTDWTYASLLHDFARGMAYVKTNNLSSAKKSLKELRRKSKDTILDIINIPFNSSYMGAFIAEHILSASILFQEKKYMQSIDDLKKAIRMEDSLIYKEPKDWLIPARQYLGAYLMKLKKFKQAEQVYRDDLMWNPGNGWSLLGLSQSLVAQGKREEAVTHAQGYLKSFSEADEIPPGSVY